MGVSLDVLGGSGIEFHKRVVCMWERSREPILSHVVYQVWVGWNRACFSRKDYKEVSQSFDFFWSTTSPQCFSRLIDTCSVGFKGKDLLMTRKKWSPRLFASTLLNRLRPNRSTQTEYFYSVPNAIIRASLQVSLLNVRVLCVVCVLRLSVDLPVCVSRYKVLCHGHITHLCE
jgi:hypothetical protein